MQKHHSLPEKPLTPEALANWIREASKETFKDETKIYYTPEEVQEMESESTCLGREIIKIADLKKYVMDKLSKGSEKDIEITIPEGMGLKTMLELREALDRKVEKGFEVVETKIFSIPNEDGNMYFFDAEGNLFGDRTRKMSVREKQEIFGLFSDGTMGKMAANH